MISNGARRTDLPVLAFATCAGDTRAGRVANWLVMHAREPMLAEYTPDSCIAATRLCVTLATAAGVAARPLPLRAVAANRATTKDWTRTGVLPTAHPNRPLDPHAPWAVGIGFGPPDADPASRPGRYNGHLACLLEPDEPDAMACLVDLALDQAARPERFLVLGAVSLPVSAEFLAGQSVAYRLLPPPNGADPCAVFYLVNPHDDETWRLSRDWLDTGRQMPLAAGLARRLLKDLER